MSTAISWVHDPRGIQKAETWEIVEGCTKVSAACKNCWAETMHPRLRTGHPFSEVITRPDRLEVPLHWRKPRRVFVCSRSDLFHPKVTEPFIRAVFSTMRMRPEHTFLVLTKRPERMRRILSKGLELDGRLFWPVKNCWLGVSVEDQETADERIPLLLGDRRPTPPIPAAHWWVSIEPILGPIDIRQWLPVNTQGKYGRMYHSSGILDWVVVGGESGPRARSFDPDWARDILAQCRAAGTACYVKQMGSAWAKEHGCHDRKGEDPAEWPADLRVREYPEV